MLVRNQRKDGTVFVNDMQIYPLRNGEGKVTHFIGYHREGGTRVRTGDTGIRGLPNWVREDRLTGLASRYYFEDVLKRDFALAQRDKTDIALLLFDIDQLGPYNEIFDRAGGDAVVKRVARAIAGSFRRGTDIVGRWEGASVIVLMHGTQRRSRDPARHHRGAPRARAADPSSALDAEIRDRERRRRHPHRAARRLGRRIPEGGGSRRGARQGAGPQPHHRRRGIRLPLKWGHSPFASKRGRDLAEGRADGAAAKGRGRASSPGPSLGFAAPIAGRAPEHVMLRVVGARSSEESLVTIREATFAP